MTEPRKTSKLRPWRFDLGNFLHYFKLFVRHHRMYNLIKETCTTIFYTCQRVMCAMTGPRDDILC